MKKLILGIFIFLELSNAYEITNSYWTGNGIDKHKVSTVKCNNSTLVHISYYPNKAYPPRYFSGDGGIYNSWNNAVHKSCSTKNKQKVYIKKFGLVCKNRKSMQKVLENDVNYTIERIAQKSCFTISKKVKVNIIKKYNIETFLEHYEKNKPRRKAKRIDIYYKVSDTFDTYYVRGNDIIK